MKLPDIRAGLSASRRALSSLKDFKTFFHDFAPWFAVALLVLIVYFWDLGTYGLIDPDEGRYSEIPREMIESGDFVTPRLNYVKYFEKPALHYWLTAASFVALGQNEFAARLCPVLMGMGGCLLTLALARRMTRSTRGGGLAAAVLASSLLWYALSRINIIDMTLTFFFTLAMAGYRLWLDAVPAQGKPAQQGRWWILLFYAGMALATLSKGLIGIVLPGGIAVLHLAATMKTRGGRTLLRLFSPWGMALYFLLTVPWFRAVCAANPDFFDFFFIHEHFTRFLTTAHDRWEPFWFFIPILLAGFVPWTGMLLDAFHAARGKWGILSRDDGLFLGLWFGLPFLFFSLSGSKLIPYILPCMPPLAILIGAAFEGLLREAPGARRIIRRFIGLNALILIPLALAGVLYPMFSEGQEHLLPVTLPLSASLTLFWLASFVLLWSRGDGFLLLCVLALVMLLSAEPGFDVSARRNSPRSLAAVVSENIQPHDTLVAYRNPMQGLGFYMKRRLVVADHLGELEFGAAQEDDPRWFLSTLQLRKLWNGPDRVLLVAQARQLPDLTRALGREPVQLGEAGRTILFSNF